MCGTFSTIYIEVKLKAITQINAETTHKNNEKRNSSVYLEQTGTPEKS